MSNFSLESIKNNIVSHKYEDFVYAYGTAGFRSK